MVKRKIVYLHPHFTIAGGAGRFVLETAIRMVERGWEVSIVSIRSDDIIVGEYRHKIDFYDLGGPLSSELNFWIRFPCILRKVIRIVDQINPDILFPHIFPANWWGWAYKIKRPKTPLVWMCHEPSAFIHSWKWIMALPNGAPKLFAIVLNPILKLIDISLAKKSDVIISNSNHTIREIDKVYSSQRVLNEALVLGVNQPNSDKVFQRLNQVCAIGKLTSYKNIDILIRAISKLKERGKLVQLKIIGEGDQKNTLRAHAESLGVSSQIDFCGAVSDSDLSIILYTSKALSLNSINEPFGLVTIEAMAHGTPPIVVDSGGPAETVADGINGYHVEAKNANLLADKIYNLMVDDQLFETLSRNAKTKSFDYCWDKCTARMISVFDALLNKTS